MEEERTPDEAAQNMEESQVKRLNKFIGETGFCSRREADGLIEAGRVTVNGETAIMGMKVTPDVEVRIDGKLIREPNEKPVYLALHKPPGIECTTNPDVKDNIIEFLNYPKRIFPIGRLDKASEGLILLTNDGDIVNKILRARNNHEKEYHVTVNQPISPRFISRMAAGVPILDTVTRECEVEQTGKDTFRIVLTQGLNRQIRRMCEFLGYEVTRLIRVRIINIKLDLPMGRHRDLSETEIEQLNELIADSGKTEEASLPKPNPQESRSERKPYDKRQRFDKPAGRNTERSNDRTPSDRPQRRVEFIKKQDSKTPRDRDDNRDERFVKRFDTKDSDATATPRNYDRKDFDKPRDERPREERSRPERKREDPPRDERSHDDAPRDYKPRDERPRDERPRREDRPEGQDRGSKEPVKRKIEFIKKDDPNYRPPGEY